MKLAWEARFIARLLVLAKELSQKEEFDDF
jgi:hypothetical protein